MNDRKAFEDGVLIYEPWYSRIMVPLELLEKYLSLPVTLSVDGVTLSDILGEVAVRLMEVGLEMTLPVFSLAYLLSLKIANRIYRGVREQAEVTIGVSATVEANVITD